MTVVETPAFLRRAKGILSEAERADLVAYLAEHPDSGKIMEGTGGELRMEAPFVEWSKADIVKRGLELGVPYELTWSCYEGGNYPCGACGTCIDRNRAFELNGVRDPLLDVLDAQRAQAGK